MVPRNSISVAWFCDHITFYLHTRYRIGESATGHLLVVLTMPTGRNNDIPWNTDTHVHLLVPQLDTG